MDGVGGALLKSLGQRSSVQAIDALYLDRVASIRGQQKNTEAQGRPQSGRDPVRLIYSQIEECLIADIGYMQDQSGSSEPVLALCAGSWNSICVQIKKNEKIMDSIELELIHNTNPDARWHDYTEAQKPVLWAEVFARRACVARKSRS